MKNIAKGNTLNKQTMTFFKKILNLKNKSMGQIIQTGYMQLTPTGSKPNESAVNGKA